MAIRFRSIILPATLFLAVAFNFVSQAIAQWSLIKSFGAQVRSVYFLDEQGAPSTGLVGLSNSRIWVTNDNGTSWRAATTPYSPTPLAVTDFTFLNTQVGFCSVIDFFKDTGEIWITNDGGLYWQSVYSGGGFVSIAFCSGTHTIIVPAWSYTGDSSVESTDSGKTWKPFAAANLTGVTVSGSQAFIGNRAAPFPLYSSNGGATWNDVYTDTTETWAPHAIAGTSTFFAVAEKTRLLLKSTDGGATWSNPYTFAPTAMPTGSIMGTLSDLFVQTNTDGFYYSNDGGNTWSRVCGPTNADDTRFYVKGKEVFAGDMNSNLWHTPNGSVAGVPALSLDEGAIHFSGVRCATYDSILYFSFGGGCNTVTLNQATIRTGGAAFSLVNDTLPMTFNGADSLAILYSPTTAPMDSGTLFLQFTSGASTSDTVIKLYGTSTDKANYVLPGPTIITVPYACTPVDTTVMIRNLSCDTLMLAGTSLTNYAIFKLLPFKIPYKIPPRDSIAITVSASSQNDGVFHTALKLTMLSGASILINDSIPITYNVQHGGEGVLSSLNITLPDACDEIDTSITIQDTRCDSIALLSATVNDSSIFRLDSMGFPAVIQPGNELALPIRIVPDSQGTFSTTFDLRYASGHSIVDTQIRLSLFVQYDLPLRITVPGSTINLGDAGTPCVTASKWITFQNSLCHSLQIRRMSWIRKDSQFWFDPLPLPVTLASDTGMDSLLVHFKPDVPATSSDELRVTLDLNGREVDTTLTFVGTGVSSYADTLLTPSLEFDSILLCKTLVRKCELVNLSCDSVVAVSANVKGTVGYDLLGGSFPQTIGSGDTLRLQYQLQPTGSGIADDSAIITLLDPTTGTKYTRAVALDGFVLPNSNVLSINSTSFSLLQIPPCATIDSFIMLTNRGCDNIVIQDTSFAGDGAVQLLPTTSFPISLPPDSSIRIPFEISPNNDSVKQTSLKLQGQNIDTTVVFTYSSIAGGRLLSLSAQDSLFATRPCQPVAKTFVLANTGCQAVLIDSITLAAALVNSTQFTLQGAPSLPLLLQPHETIQWKVQYDPNGNGDNQVTLGVYSNAGNLARTLELIGTVVGTVPTARIALRASNGSAQCSGYGADTTSIDAIVLDGIGDSTALSTVAITISANWNLLTPLQFIPAPGWSLIDTSSANGLFTIRLRHDAGGPVAAGTKLIQCVFYITVSDSTNCNIRLLNTLFNNTTSNYEQCVLASIPVADPVTFTESDTCGTPQLREMLEGRIALRILSIHPNPVPVQGGSARMNVTFELARPGEVHFIVRDVIGRQDADIFQPFSAGIHTYNLKLPDATEGTYFLEIESGGYTAEGKAMIANGSFPAY